MDLPLGLGVLQTLIAAKKYNTVAAIAKFAPKDEAKLR